MTRLRARWFLVFTVGVLLLSSWSAARLLRGDTPTLPRAADAAAARRAVAAAEGTVDEREPTPPAAIASGSGVVEPAQSETRVSSGVPGRIAAVRVREGDRVPAGALLVELDDAVELAAFAAAEAEVESARVELARIVRGSRGEDIQAATADAETARARAALSRGVAERLDRAGADGGATVDEIDRARRQSEGDDAAARAADARRSAVLAGSRREDVQRARAQLAAAEARRDQARATRERLRVMAPLAGEILQVKFRAGEYYQPGTDPLLVIGDTSALRARLDIDERDIDKVKVGAPVVVRANAFPGRDFAGRIVELGRRMGRKNVRTDDPVERNDTKILEVVVALDRPDGLVVGQRVTGYVTASPGRSP